MLLAEAVVKLSYVNNYINVIMRKEKKKYWLKYFISRLLRLRYTFKGTCSCGQLQRYIILLL